MRILTETELLKVALREPVSVNSRTGLRHAEMEIGKWRAETGARNPPARTEKPKIAGQRLGRASPTRGNVADSYPPGNNTPETRLPG
jgi:predicted RNase H-like nuclease